VSDCLWCGKGFAPRRDGGKRQVFCRPACRRGFDAAGRRFVAEAIASGTLSLDALRNGAAATRALLAGATPPSAVSEPQDAVPAVSADRADEVVGLLDELLCALIELPGEAYADIMTAIPEPLSDRLDRYIEELLEEADSQP
jgi:hypothetical protein